MIEIQKWIRSVGVWRLFEHSASQTSQDLIEPLHSSECTLPAHHKLMIDVVNTLLLSPEVLDGLDVQQGLEGAHNFFNRDVAFCQLVFRDVLQPIVKLWVIVAEAIKVTMPDAEVWSVLVVISTEVFPSLQMKWFNTATTAQVCTALASKVLSSFTTAVIAATP